MYQKLNYLASVTAPDYSPFGYMRGNLITLTIGGYLYEQPGIMTGITYTVPEESPWEIKIGTEGVPDESVQEIPHMIKVTGFSFKPIQNFVPSLQKNIFGTENEALQAIVDGTVPVNSGTGNVTFFGKQRYIALTDSTKPEDSNYGQINATQIKFAQEEIERRAEIDREREEQTKTVSEISTEGIIVTEGSRPPLVKIPIRVQGD